MFKKYFSDLVWWNYICYAYSINKKTNITSTASINCHSIKVRDSYILNTVLLAIVLENNELKKFVSKMARVIISII